MDDVLLTPEESAKYLKMHVDSIRRLLRSKKLPGVKVGGAWRIPRSSLDGMLGMQRRPPGSETAKSKEEDRRGFGD